MMASLFLLGARHRFIVLLLLTIVTLATGAGLSKLHIDTSFNSLIPADDTNRMVYQKVLEQFGSDNQTIIYVEDKSLWSVDKLTALEALHSDLKTIAYLNNVESLFTLQDIEGVMEEGERTIRSAPLLNGLPNSEVAALDAKQRALSNPLYVGTILSADGDATAIIITPKSSISDLDGAKRVGVEASADLNEAVYNAVEEVLARHQGEFSELFHVGPPRVDAELKLSMQRDFKLLGPLSAFVLIGSILLFMRSGIAAIVPIVTSALTIIWTFGVLGWTGVPLNILTAMIPSLIIVIGSTEDTHLIAAYFRGLMENETNNNSVEPAISYMARHTGMPLVLTILTTALGFASNLFSSIGLIQDFAIASTFAIFTNGIITILVVPLLLTQFSSRKKSSAASVFSNSLPDKIVGLFRVSQDKAPTAILCFTAVLCAFFTYQASSLYVTNDPLSYFPENKPLIQQTRLLHERLSGVKVFFVTLEADKERAFWEPENLKKIERIQDFMNKQGGYDSNMSIADYLKYVNQEFRGQFSQLSLPKTKEMVAQYLMFFRRNDLEAFVSHDYRQANIIVRHNISDSHTLNLYVEELTEAVTQIAGPDIKTQVVGENLMVNQAAESLMVSQVKALAVLLVFIFVIMSIMFTSVKGGMIALVPSLIPILLMFGLMGLLGIPLNPGTAMVAVIAVGIAIDGTIHLLSRYQELCCSSSDYRAAVNQAVQEVATPLIISSLSLSFGFGILLFSSFTVVAQFGALAAATMLISIFANLLITPIIMERTRLVCIVHILAMKINHDVLDKSPLFNQMSNYQRRKAILISELHEFLPGEKVLTQGTHGRSMFMLLEGEAEVMRHDGDALRNIANLSAGDIFGEIGYVRSVERTADVTATTVVSVLRFDYDRMQKDLKFFPNIIAQLNFNISAILGERLADKMAEEDRAAGLSFSG